MVGGKPHGIRAAKVKRFLGGGGFCAQGKPWVLAQGVLISSLWRRWASEQAREGVVKAYRAAA